MRVIDRWRYRSISISLERSRGIGRSVGIGRSDTPSHPKHPDVETPIDRSRPGDRATRKNASRPRVALLCVARARGRVASRRMEARWADAREMRKVYEREKRGVKCVRAMRVEVKRRRRVMA